MKPERSAKRVWTVPWLITRNIANNEMNFRHSFVFLWILAKELQHSQVISETISSSLSYTLTNVSVPILRGRFQNKHELMQNACMSASPVQGLQPCTCGRLQCHNPSTLSRNQVQKLALSLSGFKMFNLWSKQSICLLDDRLDFRQSAFLPVWAVPHSDFQHGCWNCGEPVLMPF